jgi:hypothetical protein
MSEETFEAYPGGPCVTRVDLPDLTPQDFGLQVDADGRIVNEHFPPTGSPPMPHTPTSLFADMLSLLIKLEWTEETTLIDRDGDLIYSRACPQCEEFEYDGHAPGCHLQSTIALAEEHLNVR